jgi:RNA polymerase subunit RPABC4/transcription elongation factor Spt4
VPELWPEVIPGSPEEAVDEPAALPPGSSLIPCHDCGRPLSGDAEICPACGARNRWVHPQVARFLRRRRGFAKRFANLHGEARGYVLSGTSRREPGLLDAAANAVGGLGMIAPLTAGGLATVIGLSVARQYVSKALRDAAGKGGQAFVIDFRHDPPAYETTDDDFWEDVLVFFGLVEPLHCEEAPEPPKPPPLACHKCYTLMDGPPDDGRCPHCGARLRWF